MEPVRRQAAMCKIPNYYTRFSIFLFKIDPSFKHKAKHAGSNACALPLHRSGPKTRLEDGRGKCGRCRGRRAGNYRSLSFSRSLARARAEGGLAEVGKVLLDQPCSRFCNRQLSRGVRHSTGLRKVDIRLPGKGNSNSHGARPVY